MAQQEILSDERPSAQIIENMDIVEYHDHPAISASGLKLFLKCPESYRYEMLAPEREEERRKEKQALVIGSAFHTLCLEPQLFRQRFHIMGDDVIRNEKHSAYKAEIAAADGRTILKKKEIADIEKMARAVGRDQEAMKYLKRPGIIEASLFWDDPETGVQCRARPDLILPDDDIVINFKSAADAEHGAFEKSLWSMGYDIAIDHYGEGYYHCFGRQMKRYIFICAEKSPPWLTAVYPANEALQIAGQMRKRKLIDIYARCLKSNAWPGLNGGREREIGLPGWAAKQLENEGEKA